VIYVLTSMEKLQREIPRGINGGRLQIAT